MGKKIVMVLLALALLAPAAAAETKTSPAYTIMVALSYESPFVDDGRSSFAEFAFSASFKNVRFHYDFTQELPMLGYRIDGAKGKGTLSRHRLNKVQTNSGQVTPEVTKEPGEEFEAWLKITPGPLRPEWLKGREDLLTPMPLQFRTSWGREMMRWDYVDGDSYLEEEGIEVFLVDWESIAKGEPVSLKIPYQGANPEDKGEWWIEYIPEK